MKVRVSEMEFYPVYCFSDSRWDEEIEITKEEIERYEAGMAAYRDVQAMIGEKLKERYGVLDKVRGR